MKKDFRGDKMKNSVLYIILILLLLFLQACGDDNNPVQVETDPHAALMLNEVCPENANVIKDDSGNYGDWIEIINNSDKSVDIKGVKIKYTYNDGVEREYEYEIPVETIIEPRGFQVVWCDGKNEGLHTNFDLKSEEGGIVYLITASNKLLNKLDYTDSFLTDGTEDLSLARMLSEDGVHFWKYFGPGYDWWPTPGQDNSLKIPIPDIQTVFLNEIMIKNETTIQDGNGAYSDWVEIYNRSNTEINLIGYTLRYEYDDNSTPVKLEYKLLSDLKVPGKSFQLIWFNNGDAVNEYTGFEFIDNKGGKITLINQQGKEIDVRDYSTATGMTGGTADVSNGRKTDGDSSWIMFGSGYDKPVTAGKTNG